MFKKITLLLITLIAALITVNANAGNVAKAYGYSPLFAEANIGLTTIYDAGRLNGSEPSVNLAFGYQFLPQIFIRAGIQMGPARPVRLNEGWFTENTFLKSGISFDIGWDIINTINEDNVNKFYHIQPYFRLEEFFGIAKEKSVAALTAGAGLRNTFRINDKLDIVLDINAMLANESKWRQAAGYFIFIRTGVGIAYKF